MKLVQEEEYRLHSRVQTKLVNAVKAGRAVA